MNEEQDETAVESSRVKRMLYWETDLLAADKKIREKLLAQTWAAYLIAESDSNVTSREAFCDVVGCLIKFLIE